MDGIILIDKPARVTSHDVVLDLRRILGVRRVGHFGTLDPLATGVLIAACGQATRLFPYFVGHDKSYEGRVRFGYSTDTYDLEGNPTSPEVHEFPSETEVSAAMAGFMGKQEQVPPAFSAKKHRGTPLYRLARNHEPVPLKPSPVVIHAFEIRAYAPPDLDFFARCSGGTYIRSLAHDLGLKLGCRGHLTRLVRTASGSYRLEGCLSLDRVRELSGYGAIERFLIPLEVLLPEHPKLVLTDRGERCARNGNQVLPEHVLSAGGETGPEDPRGKETVFRLFTPGGRLVALATKSPGRPALQPVLVFS